MYKEPTDRYVDDSPDATLSVLFEYRADRIFIRQIYIVVLDLRRLDILRRRIRRQLIARNLLEPLVHLRVRVMAVVQRDGFVAPRLLQHV